MATYNYACEACHHQWEAEQRMTDDPIRKCPKCGKMKARRQITGGNFILKGGGWYADLYHKPSGNKTAESSTPSTTKAESKTEAKVESKPEAKADPKPDAKPTKSKKASD